MRVQTTAVGPERKDDRMTPQPLTEALRGRIDEVFARFHAAGSSGPGLAYGLVRGGEVVHTGGIGTAETGTDRPLGPDAVFRIASMSKSVTAAAVLLLRDAGALRLDDPIAEHVPGFTVAPGLAVDSPALTIRHCLTMSGGLPTDDPWADRQEALTTAEFEAILRAGVRFIDIPGVRFEYSNLGFALLGRVVEEISGQEFTAFVTERLLRPLGMSATEYDHAAVPADLLVTGHRRGPDGPLAVPFTDPGAFSAIGGLLSSVRDIARWTHWLAEAQTPGNAPESGPLSRASRREMQQLHRSIPRAHGLDPALGLAGSVATGGHGVAPGYGYGLFVDEDPRWGTLVQHSGGYPGFGSHMRWHAASGWGVIAFGNTMYAPVLVPAEEALRLVLAEVDAPSRAVRSWDAVAAARALVERFATGDTAVLADPMFSPNVLADSPDSERAAALAAAHALVGYPTGDAAVAVSAPTPARLQWELPAERGRLALTLRLTPTTPALIHSVTVRALPNPDAALEPVVAALRTALQASPTALAATLAPLLDAGSAPALERLGHWRALLGPLTVGPVDRASSAEHIELPVTGGTVTFGVALDGDAVSGRVHLALRPRPRDADAFTELRPA